MRPRRGLLALGFVLMVINRVSGFVLPASSKFLIDDVINKHHIAGLPRLVGIVLLATVVQGITSFSLTQLLSKAAQRLIADLREAVQKHISRLPVSFYDCEQNRRSRIAHHERRRRNSKFAGHGACGFCGGSSDLRHCLVVADSHQSADDADCGGIAGSVRRVLGQGFRHHPSHLSRTRQDQRRSNGTAHRVAGRRSRHQGIPRGKPRRSCVRDGSPPAAR